MMPKLSPAVRIAAGSILLLSLAHIAVWAFLGYSIRFLGIEGSQFTILYLAIYLIAAAGIAGVIVAIGIFRAKRWARLAALVVAALTGVVCAFALLVLSILIHASPNGFGLFGNLIADSSSDFLKIACIYLIVLCTALWWIVLFSRKAVAEQFDRELDKSPAAVSSKSLAPLPPITLLAWLMIISSGLSALSWPLILGRIPAMLFTHIFSAQISKWIWAANILLFAACGIGLLKLQRWSYTATIGLHAFWLVSLLLTQLSPNYDQYTNKCLNALELSQTYPTLTHLRFPQWLSALATAIPTALLLAGLFYYRRAFLKAVQDSHHPPS